MAEEKLPEEMEMEEAEMSEPAPFEEGGEDEGEDSVLEVSTLEVSGEGEGETLQEGLSGLVENWKPTTPEGEKYLAYLIAVMDKFGMDEGEEGPPEAMEASDFGFDLGLLGKEAARRAMKPEGM